MTDTLKTLAADVLGVTLTDSQVAAMDSYAGLLLEWNQMMNLTAITDPEEVRVRHFLDSLSLVAYIPADEPASLVDIGTGAGFPGLVLAIACPTLTVTLMDSTGKKLKFLNHVIETLKIPNAKTVHIRAEDAGQQPAYRAKYDLAVARAVARLPGLLEYALPMVRVDGAFIAMKGSTVFEEVEDSSAALRVLGGKVMDIESVQLPGKDMPHHLVIVSKVKKTPRTYPRNPGIPTREPIT